MHLLSPQFGILPFPRGADLNPSPLLVLASSRFIALFCAYQSRSVYFILFFRYAALMFLSLFRTYLLSS
jgi:hypothetical protein